VRTLLVTGAAGQLGHRVLASAARRPHLAVVGCTRADLDITDPDSVAHAFDRHRPDVVLHAAAWTAVDAAESHRDEAFAANADGAAHVARAAAARGLPLLHISTDYVFDGTSARGYLPGDPPAPLGVYGASKRAGEEAVLAAAPALARIFRVAWLYDREGRNFLNTMLRAADAGTSLRVVDDQTGTPTHAGHFAELLLDIAEAPDRLPPGIWHYGHRGTTSWFGFAQAIFALTGRTPVLAPCSTADYPTPAKRPRYSHLDPEPLHRALGREPVDWRVALEECVGGRG
jgi:dTDP-4-dehydrorhamnose reductase